MQSPRLVLRPCSGLRVERVAPLFRFSLRPSSAASTAASTRRGQHDKHGPHKEYFQIPGKEPKPDLTPYIRESSQPSQSPPQSESQSQLRSRTSSHDSSTNQTQYDQQIGARPKGWVRLPRIVRSLIWSVLFGSLGLTSGIALITWDYLQPPYEPGSPEEKELAEDMQDLLETDPIVQDLREQEWIEVDPFTPDIQHGLKGRNLVHQVLGPMNPQGVFVKLFHHPTSEFTMLVFLPGFGVEGWPDVMHGGAIATLLQESLNKHIAYYYSGYFTTPNSTTKVDYKQPCRPGEVYGILVAPSGRKAVRSGNVHLTELQITSLLVQLSSAPVLATEFDISTNTETHTISTQTAPGHKPTHVICQSIVKLVPKQLNHDGRAFEIGGKNDEAFGRALNFLKSRPEFKNSHPQPTPTPAPSTDDENTGKE